MKEDESWENNPNAYDDDNSGERLKKQIKGRAEPNLLPADPNTKVKKIIKPKKGNDSTSFSLNSL